MRPDAGRATGTPQLDAGTRDADAGSPRSSAAGAVRLVHCALPARRRRSSSRCAGPGVPGPRHAAALRRHATDAKSRGNQHAHGSGYGSGHVELHAQPDAAGRGDGVRERRSAEGDAPRSRSASSPARAPLCLEPVHSAILRIDGSSTQLQQCGCLARKSTESAGGPGSPRLSARYAPRIPLKQLPAVQRHRDVQARDGTHSAEGNCVIRDC